MSTWRTILSGTLGVVYSGATGKPDPWATSNLSIEEARNILIAQGIDPNTATDDEWTSAKNQSTADVTKTISTAPPPNIDCDKPADGLTGFYCSVKKFETYIIVILILAIAVYLGGKYFEGRKN